MRYLHYRRFMFGIDPKKYRRSAKKRKRYSLNELLENVRKGDVEALNAETAWVRQGVSVGAELT